MLKKLSFVKGSLIITLCFFVFFVASVVNAMAEEKKEETWTKKKHHEKMGVTWTKRKPHNSVMGIDTVGCKDCNPYVGDTPCSSKLPVLCIKIDGSEKPEGLETNFYKGWAGGHIGLTFPIRGDLLTSVDDANLLCEYQFGEGYRIAEHHDGYHNGSPGGWNWSAYGNIEEGLNFWIFVDDQPDCHCW